MNEALFDELLLEVFARLSLPTLLRSVQLVNKRFSVLALSAIDALDLTLEEMAKLSPIIVGNSAFRAYLVGKGRKIAVSKGRGWPVALRAHPLLRRIPPFQIRSLKVAIERKFLSPLIALLGLFPNLEEVDIRCATLDDSCCLVELPFLPKLRKVSIRWNAPMPQILVQRMWNPENIDSLHFDQYYWSDIGSSLPDYYSYLVQRMKNLTELDVDSFLPSAVLMALPNLKYLSMIVTNTSINETYPDFCEFHSSCLESLKFRCFNNATAPPLSHLPSLKHLALYEFDGFHPEDKLVLRS